MKRSYEKSKEPFGIRLKTYKFWLNDEQVYYNRYIKNVRTYVDEFCTIFCDLNVLEDVKCEFFTIISIDSLLAYENKYYMQVYLDNCGYKL